MGLLVYGASGHGAVVADTAIAQGLEVVGFVDDRAELRGKGHAGGTVVCVGFDEAVELCRAGDHAVVVGIGNQVVRRRLSDAFRGAGVELATVVHPTAWVSSRARIEGGTVVFAGAIVQAGATIGRDCILNTACSVDHDCVLADGVHLSPGVHLGGTVIIGERTHVGVGASVRNNLTIGARVVVGVGAAVVADLPDDVVAMGVPARIRQPTGG